MHVPGGSVSHRHPTQRQRRDRNRLSPAAYLATTGRILRQLAAVPAQDAFEDEVRRAAFHQAAEIVRPQVQPATWNAFWQTSVLGQSVEEAARQLNLSVGSIYAARSRVLARLRREIENTLGEDE